MDRLYVHQFPRNLVCFVLYHLYEFILDLIMQICVCVCVYILFWHQGKCILFDECCYFYHCIIYALSFHSL